MISHSRLINRFKIKSKSLFPNSNPTNRHQTKPTKKTKNNSTTSNRSSKFPHSNLDHLKSISNPISAVHHLLSSSPSSLSYPSCSSLLYRLSKSSRFIPILLSFLSFIHTKHVPLQEPLFSALIQNLGRLGLIDLAIQVFRSIARFNVPPNCPSKVSINFLLNALIDNGRVVRAREVLDSCPKLGIRSNIVSYNIIIKGCCKNGDLVGAHKVLDEMVERRNIRPSVVTFNIFIGYLCKNENVDSALRLKDEMVKKWRVPPNEITYAMIMKGLCEEARYNDAKKLMFDMEFQNCKTGLVNYGVLINDCAKRGDFEVIKELLSKMKKRKMKPDDVIYNVISGCLCKQGKVFDAYKILIEMQIKGGCETSAATFRVLVDGCCGVNELGFRVLNVMVASNHWPRLETLVCLIKGLCVNGKLEESCFVLKEMEKKGKVDLGLEAWMALVNATCVNNNKKVVNVVDELIE
ncbi:hypothetical protein LUZ60_003610 [Juncus effusus]|nr:hypothetical protein LUZ60_003610 [Juncus effusus]